MGYVAPALAAFLVAIQSTVPSYGTIRGRVLDPDGQPMAGVQITVVENVTERDFRTFGSALSREDGTFEIGAPARRILLMARPGVRLRNRQPAPPQHYPPAYFPGVLDRLEAWPIDVKPGEIIELDFHMPPVFVGSIKMMVSGPAGYSLDHVRVIRPEANQIRNVKVSDDGIGVVDSLREGRYIVSARGRSTEAQLAAWEIVHLTSGEIAVSLDLKPTATVHGRIVTERDGLAPITTARVAAVWTDGAVDLDPLGRDEGQVSADGSFTVNGLFGTRTFRVAGLDSGWKVVAVRHGRTDISSSGIDVAPGTTMEVSIVVSRK